jgi:ubiquinone/menaquinone biosynthesis C-methylase UbiE
MADLAAYASRKSELIGALRGTVLEIGAGRGRNFGYFRSGVDWIGLEPNQRQHRHLARRAAGYGYHRPILAAPAERIPLPDASVDAVLATVVLCSVADQGRVLAEIQRVLRPGGAFVFFEHVAAPAGTRLRRVQQICVHRRDNPSGPSGPGGAAPERRHPGPYPRARRPHVDYLDLQH